MAELEKEFGIKGTYYFRIVPESFDESIIKQIEEMGHEIGYHYEEIDLVLKRKTRDERREILRFAQNDPPSLSRSGIKDNEPQHAAYNKLPTAILDAAWELFKKNVEKIRNVAEVNTICPHGSPLSPFDNKMIWDKYDYKKAGIIGDAHLDTDWNKFGYLTDTGRRWNGASVSIRDKVENSQNSEISNWFKKTGDIIANVDKLPEKIMLTIHPERWNDNLLFWLEELISQNIKNVIKKWFFVKNEKNAVE